MLCHCAPGCTVRLLPVTGGEQAPELGPRGENGGVVLKGCSSWGNSCFQAAWILCSVPNTHTQPRPAISNGSWLSHVCQEGEPEVTAAGAVVNTG